MTRFACSNAKIIGYCAMVVGAAALIACSPQSSSKTDAETRAELNEEQIRGAKRTGVLSLSDHALPRAAGHKDYYEVELAPYESVELKYSAPKNARIGFQWTSTGKVRSDFHAHPTEGGEDLTESYDISDSTQMQGLYIAPFSGIHGWHWQNRTTDKVTLRLQAFGGFTDSTVITDSSHESRALNPVSFN